MYATLFSVGRRLKPCNSLVVYKILILGTCPVLVTQSCLIHCDPMDCSPPGFSVHSILQARILKWGAIPFSRGSPRPRDRKCVSCTGRWILYHCTTLGRQSAYRAEFHPIYSLASILIAPVHDNLSLSNNFYSTCWTLSKS